MGTRTNGDIVRDVARKMGAKVVGTRRSHKHPGLLIRTRDGVEFWMRVSLGKIEPYKQRGWVRQAINRASKRRANDNGKSQAYSSTASNQGGRG